jgi:hypothetical protein
MKGIITDYFEEKRFGFIKDENEDKRFFHISDIKGGDMFLSNLVDYYYTDSERICYVVNFTPSENKKGLKATNVNLTKQVFNDKAKNNPFGVIITDFKYYSRTLTRVVTGIKNGSSIPVGATRGSNGTYRIGYPEVCRQLNIHFRRIDDIGWGTINVRGLVLTINNRSNITGKLIEILKGKLVGQTISIIPTSGTWVLSDISILRI